MKDILQKIDELEKAIDKTEPAPEMQRIDEQANMNISMSGENANEVASLLKIMTGGGAPDASPVDADMINPPMSKLKAIVGPMGPKPMDGPDMMDDDGCGPAEEVAGEDWDNSPDEEYKDTQYMTKDLAGGINREKGQYKAAQPGDNAMAMETLQNELRDALMSKMAEGKDDKDEKFDEMGCVKEMKKLYASGCTKEDMFKKVHKSHGCPKGDFEKLFAAHCG